MGSVFTKSALIVVDVQYDFLPPLPDNPSGGSLAVATGDGILPYVRRLLDDSYDWKAIAVSQDYHPEGHISFASTHGLPVFTEITIPNPYDFGLDGNDRQETITQMLWPDHCLKGSHGAEVESSVRNSLQRWKDGNLTILIQKGTHKEFDAYSAFLADTHTPPDKSELKKRLVEHGVETVFVVGLATDYCVRATAIDAKRAGFNVFVIQEGIRAVGGDDATKKVIEEWKARGIEVISINDIRLGVLRFEGNMKDWSNDGM